jgi:hypothetical protein
VFLYHPSCSTSYAGEERSFIPVPIQNLNPDVLMMESAEDWYRCNAADFQRLCPLKTLSGMTRVWSHGNEAANGRVSEPAAACYPVVI